MPILHSSRRRFIFPLFSLTLSAGLFLSALGSASASAVADEQSESESAVAADLPATGSSSDKKPNKKQKAADKKKAASDKSTNRRLDSIEKSLEKLAKEMQALREAMAAPAVAPTVEPKTEPTAPAAQDQTPKAADARPVSVKLDSSWLNDVAWRSIGPANMAGRITDLAIHEQDPSLWWIATASGGLLKSTNRGVTIQHQFDREKVVSVGCIATDPKNKDVLWVGTGEINPRNSVSYGNGVYKSVDGGKTFTHKGLDSSYQIARILIDPNNTDTVYVGVAGRLYGTNSERGVYKSTNGGDSWEQVFFVDDRTGVIEMAMHPEDPNTMIVAMWDRLRDGFDSWPGAEPRPEGMDGYDPIRKWGPGGGLYKTIDGGKSWNKLTKGLPTGMTGRIGIDWQSKSPHSIYAIIDCAEIGKGPKPFDAFLGIVGTDNDGKPTVTHLLPECPAATAGVEVGDVLMTIDDSEVKEFDQLLDVLRKKKIGDKIQLTLSRGGAEVSVATKLTGRPGTSAQRAPTITLGASGKDQTDGIALERVTEGGPAEKAGLRAGDVIAQVDGKDVSDFRQFMTDLQQKFAGDKLKINALRGEEKLEVTVTLEARAQGGQQTAAQSNVFMGIQGQDATGGGATLTAITEGGPAEKAGLKSNDVVSKIDGKDITNYETLVSEIRGHKPEDKLKVTVKRGEKSVEVEVTLADRLGGSSSVRPYTYSYFGQTPNIQDQQGAKGLDYGGVYKSTDGGDSWQRVNSLNTRPMYFSVVKVDPSDDQRVYVLGVSQFRSANGGVTFTGDFGRRVHADAHDLWIDPADGRHMVIGGDGGFYVTNDYGDNWDHVNTAAIGQFYHVTISPRQPYWVAGGLQDNGSWAGPAISRNGGALNEDWINVGTGDGFVCRVDPNDPDLVYSESQNGSISRRHLATGERTSIRPPRVEGVTYRFNWNTPFLLSHHNSKIFYSAGNYVFRSLDRGNDLRAISPEITLTRRGSATALSESPRDPNVLYAGTDDGALWVTRDGGHDWKNITSNLGIPDPRWVATIEASTYVDGRVYVCLDGHRSDDEKPYVFVSEDYGDHFTSLHGDLPWGSTRCLREDIKNQNLLYLGTEFAMWVSLDRGLNWTQFNNSLPTVAIHEVAQHASINEIVVATHGRSLWACDVTGLRQLKAEHVSKDIALHNPTEVTRWRSEPNRGGTNRRYVGQNPASGARLWYSLPAKAESVAVRIENIEGQVISELKGKTEAGLHMLTWNLSQTAAPTAQPGQRGGDSTGGIRRGGPPADAGGDATAARPPRGTGGGGGGGRGPRPESGASAPTQEATATAGVQETNEGGQPAETEETGEAKQEESGEPDESATRAVTGRGGPGGGQAGGGRPPQGRQGLRGGRPVPNGRYRVVLVVDGKELPATTISVERDPNVAPNAIADEEYETRLLLDQQAAEDKSKAKAAGRGVWQDD